MKKLLSAALALTLCASFAIGLTACGKKSNKDRDIAQKAITNLKDLYETDTPDTPKKEERDYKVVGKTAVQGTLYTVDWSVSDNASAYVTVGEIDADNMVTISVSRQTVDVEYTLNASVTVGKETASYSFKKLLPAKISNSNRQTTTKSISFANADARTQQTTEIQVWEQNGIKLTNNKANSSSDVANYTNPARFYSGSTIKLECAGMLHLEVDSQKFNDNDYSGNLKKSIEGAGIPCTIVDNDGDLVIDLDMAVDYIEFAMSGQTRIFAIDIDAVVGGPTDSEKVDAAIAMAKPDQLVYTEKDTYDLPETAFGADLAWKVKGESNLVSVSNNKLTVKDLPSTPTEVTLTATVTAGTETGTLEVVIKIAPPLVSENDGTPEHPYTIAEAIALANTLGYDEFYKEDGKVKEICVVGYVLDTGEWSGSFNNWSKVYIGVTATTDKESKTDALYVFRLNIDTTYLKASTDLKVGAKIIVQGPLQNYHGNTPELNNQGSFKVKAVGYELPQA